MGPEVNTFLTSSSMYNKYKFLLIILVSDLVKQLVVRDYQGNTFFRIMFTNKMVVIKFNIFHFVVNKSF